MGDRLIDCNQRQYINIAKKGELFYIDHSYSFKSELSALVNVSQKCHTHCDTIDNNNDDGLHIM